MTQRIDPRPEMDLRPAPHGAGLEHSVGVERLLLTVEQAADQLGVCRTTMYQLLNAGQVRSVRIGRSRRVPRAALSSFVASLDGGDDHAA
ncbi:helix-turn-helix domain-containing protein [Jatrophihabitans sp. YIM 134969]